MMVQNETELVTFDLPEYKRETDEVLDGQNLVVEYDSNFGGTQTLEGEAELVREWENGRRVRYMVVGNRKIQNGHVYSGNDGRRLGTVNNVQATLPADVAIEWVAKEWNGHDVDRHDDEIYVQFWSGGLNEEMSQEEWFNHTDAIRFEL